jgi:hypothetical protein
MEHIRVVVILYGVKSAKKCAPYTVRFVTIHGYGCENG